MTRSTSTETKAKLMEGDQCPKCERGWIQQRTHRFSTERGPNLPDCDWLECDECDFKTDPE